MTGWMVYAVIGRTIIMGFLIWQLIKWWRDNAK